MTLASCALEGTAARFQNSSPRAAPRGGDRPPPSGAAPGPSRPATRVRRSTNLLAAAFQSNSLGWHRAGARDKKHGEGDNARTCRAARSSALDHARSARRDPTRPAPIAERAGARGLAPRRRDAPCVPPPTPVPFASVSVANRAGTCCWRVRGWSAGETGKGRRPPIAALSVRFLWGPERRIDQDEERKERKGKRKATREGREALACVPPLGLRTPNAPRLVRGWGGSDNAGSRIWDA